MQKNEKKSSRQNSTFFRFNALSKNEKSKGKKKSQSREQRKSDTQSAFPFAQKALKTMI